jgi:hypothetical protein
MGEPRVHIDYVEYVNAAHWCRFDICQKAMLISPAEPSLVRGLADHFIEERKPTGH